MVGEVRGKSRVRFVNRSVDELDSLKRLAFIVPD